MRIRFAVGITILVVLASIIYVVAGCTSVRGQDGEPATPLPAITASDTLIADAVVVPAQNARLSFPTGGIVADVLVAEGDRVEAGQILARLNAARQTAAVAQAEATLAAAKARLSKLKAPPRSEEVTSTQAVVDQAQAQMEKLQTEPDEIEVRAAQTAVDSAQKNLTKILNDPSQFELDRAKRNLDQAKNQLYAAQSARDGICGRVGMSLEEAVARNITPASQAQCDQAQAQVLIAQVNVDQVAAAQEEMKAPPGEAVVARARSELAQAQAQLDKLMAPAQPADVDAARAEIRRAQAQLDLLEAGARPETIAVAEADIASAEAALEQAETALAEAELSAPLTGTVVSLDLKAGEYVAPGVPVIRIADLSAWQVETDDLTELSVVRIRPGDPVTITFDALPELVLSGKVTRISEFGVNKQGDITYKVVVTPDQYDERLRWNMTAVVKIEPQTE